MTVSTTNNKVQYLGNGAAVTFSFPFPGVAASDILVFLTTNGIVSQLNPLAYSVVLNPPILPNPTGIGGSVTYPLTGIPIPLGTTITIVRTLSEVQGTSLQN